jgi:hypothetical protein
MHISQAIKRTPVGVFYINTLKYPIEKKDALKRFKMIKSDIQQKQKVLKPQL